MRKNICIISIVSICILAAGSCVGNRQRKADVPEPRQEAEDVRTGQEGVVRAEGTGTSVNVEMATEIARLNAMTVLAGKLSQADTVSVTYGDGSVLVREETDTPVFDVTVVDRQVFTNADSGTVTVWILLETKVEK